jgi:hypothetical protein
MADVRSRPGQAVSDNFLDLNLGQHDEKSCYSLELLALVDSKARYMNSKHLQQSLAYPRANNLILVRPL